MEVLTKSAEETKRLGAKIGSDLAISHKPLTIALSGDLGSGKTTFVQGFAQGLGITSKIISPTFILMRKYAVSPSTVHQSLVTSFYHVDLYRFEDNIESEVRNLGLTDIWKDPKNVVIIEWAEKIKDLVPKGAMWLKFEVMDENKRKITVIDNFK